MTVSHNICTCHALGDTWSLDMSPQEKGWCVGFTEAACEPHMELGSSVAVSGLLRVHENFVKWVPRLRNGRQFICCVLLDRTII